MIRRIRKIWSTLVVTGLVLTGCSGSAPGSPTTAPTSSTAAIALPTVVATPTATPTATTQTSAAPVVLALPDSGQYVYPGTYTPHFQPSLTLTVGRQVELSCAPGFKCRGDVSANEPRWLNLGFGDVPGFEVHLFRIDKVFDPKHPGKPIDPPKDLAALILTLPGVTAIVPPKNVKVGGLDATQLDLKVGAKGAVLGPTFGFGPHLQSRNTVVRVGSDVVMIQIDVVDGTTGVAAAIDALQPLVDSIIWQ
jgi:hypothetical protein